MTVEHPSYLNVKQVAKNLGISERKVWDFIHDPATPLPHYRIGGKKLVRVKATELDQWMADHWRVDSSEVDRIVDEILN